MSCCSLIIYYDILPEVKGSFIPKYNRKTIINPINYCTLQNISQNNYDVKCCLIVSYILLGKTKMYPQYNLAILNFSGQHQFEQI